MVPVTPDRWPCGATALPGEGRSVNNTNYDVTAHSPVFWVVFLTVAVLGVVSLMGLFLYGVSRSTRN